ncbi:rz1 lytic protein [Erwinia billingiae]|nr:rz1 lytic protein [Erwinia billingiae]
MLIPPIPTPLLWHDSLVLNANLLTAIGHCNIDKAAIRKFEECVKR